MGKYKFCAENMFFWTPMLMLLGNHSVSKEQYLYKQIIRQQGTKFENQYNFRLCDEDSRKTRIEAVNVFRKYCIFFRQLQTRKLK